MNQSFFQKGICSELDHLQQQLDQHRSFFSEMARLLSEWLEPELGRGTKLPSVKQEYNERDGFHITTTQKRFQTLQKIFLIFD